MAKNKVGILFLPCGPGLNSAPAQVFLTPIFRHFGPAIFWDEPSEQRGQIVPDRPKLHWQLILETLEAASDQFDGEFVIVTESFGSILAEALFQRLSEKGKSHRVKGILHTPPVLDLRSSFLKVLRMAERDFLNAKETVRLEFLRRLIMATIKSESLADPSLMEAIVVAFESPKLLPRFFKNIQTLNHWATGFGEAGYAPEPEMREKILKAMNESGHSGKMTFAPDVPTWICTGEFDPYQSLAEIKMAVNGINHRAGRIHPVKTQVLRDVGYYPYADDPDRWEKEVMTPFWQTVVLAKPDSQA